MRLIDADDLLVKNMMGNANPITYRTYAKELIESAPTIDDNKKEKEYLVLYSCGDGSVTCMANSFKELIQSVSEYDGVANDMFNKCIKGYEESDIKGMVELHNHFAYSISAIYEISKTIYEEE